MCDKKNPKMAFTPAYSSSQGNSANENFEKTTGVIQLRVNPKKSQKSIEAMEAMEAERHLKSVLITSKTSREENGPVKTPTVEQTSKEFKSRINLISHHSSSSTSRTSSHNNESDNNVKEISGNQSKSSYFDEIEDASWLAILRSSKGFEPPTPNNSFFTSSSSDNKDDLDMSQVSCSENITQMSDASQSPKRISKDIQRQSHRNSGASQASMSDVDVEKISQENYQIHQNQSLQLAEIMKTIEPKKITQKKIITNSSLTYSTASQVTKKSVVSKDLRKRKTSGSLKQKKMKSDGMVPKYIGKVVKRKVSEPTASLDDDLDKPNENDQNRHNQSQKKVRLDYSLTSSTSQVTKKTAVSEDLRKRSQITEKTMVSKDDGKVVKRKASEPTVLLDTEKICPKENEQSSIQLNSLLISSTAQTTSKLSERTDMIISSTAGQTTSKSSEPTALINSSTAGQTTSKSSEAKEDGHNQSQKKVRPNYSLTSSTSQVTKKTAVSEDLRKRSQITEKTMVPKDDGKVVKRKASEPTVLLDTEKICPKENEQSSIQLNSLLISSTAQTTSKLSERTDMIISSTAGQTTSKSSEPTALIISSTAGQTTSKSSEAKEDDQQNDTIANYSSEDTSLEIQRKRKRKEDREWMKVKDFPTLEDAFNEINQDSTWSKCSSNQSTILFRCNKVKCRGEQCKSGLRILLSPYDLSVTLFKSLKAHTCGDITTKSTKQALTDEVKEIIKIHFLNGFKRRKIEDELIKANIRLPSKVQLNNYIASLRKEFYGRPTLSVADLHEILNKHSDVPEGDNTGFTIAHKIVTEGDISFNFFVSSKKLLSNATRSSIVCADTTYKLLWQGFPVQVIGNTDGAKQFHPSGIAVSCTENTGDFEFIFKALKNGVNEHLNVDMKPKFIMSDAAKAIPNAFFTVFDDNDDIVELMCWYHMKTAVEEYIKNIVPSNKQKEILDDIDMLQVSQNPEIFDKASKLFLEKHKEHAEFIKYFKEQWLDLHRNWYEGAGGFKVPSTDNALETFNRTIKQERTLRERLSLEHFFNQLLTWVETWSSRYDAGSKVFMSNPVIDLPLLTKAYQWTKLNKVIKNHPSRNFMMIPAAEEIDLSKWDKIYEWETFEEFKTNAFKGYKTTVPENEKWIEGTCTCPSFFKDFICKHVVGIAMRLKYLKVPMEAKQIPIGSKRKRGRPSKAKKALIKQ